MKLNKNFNTKNLLWPAIILSVLVIGAIMTNAEFVQYAPQGNTNQPYTYVPQMQNLSPGPQQEVAASPRTALMVQEAVSGVVSVVRPAVVGVSRPATGQLLANSGLTYLSPYASSAGPVGAGLIIDPSGYVLTTFQTVGRATTVKITQFTGGQREFHADVIDVDPKTDLALLKIRAQEIFPTAVLGNSDLLEVGDLVLAIGSPFGFSRTVTMGIVSNNRRKLNINGIRYPDMIQTDAAINEGNDGGPLVNIKGEVIGINLACFMPDNQFSGIGFAIPINDVLDFVNANMNI